MINTLLNYMQPLAFGVFIIAGTLCLFAKKWDQAAVNFAIANANFWVFYSGSIFK